MPLASAHVLSWLPAAVICAAAAFSAGYVLADARARGLPARKAFTWSALQAIEFPLFLWLYRRVRPKTIKGSARARKTPGS